MPAACPPGSGRGSSSVDADGSDQRDPDQRNAASHHCLMSMPSIGATMRQMQTTHVHAVVNEERSVQPFPKRHRHSAAYPKDQKDPVTLIHRKEAAVQDWCVMNHISVSRSPSFRCLAGAK
jgi:hypothetical protein